MRTKHSAAEKRTDPRPKTIWLGTDTTDARHYYRTRTETIHVVTADGEREHTLDVEAEATARQQSIRATLADWMDHVVSARGWQSTGYATTTIAEEFIQRLEAGQ